MRTTIRNIMGGMVIAALILVPLGSTAMAQTPVQAPKPSAESMSIDLIVLRPLGIVSLVAGTAIFVVSLPFSALGGNVGQAGEKLVKDPAKFTFGRKLGDI